MAQLFAGTSGWAYASWKPQFYPAKLAAAKFLEYYAQRLNTVEVNYTFRHRASGKTLENWIAATPREFKFSVKAHQRITHIKRLKDATGDAAEFLTSLAPLERSGKLGCVLFQLPPFFHADPGRLDAFLDNWPSEARAAFEFRHESWFSPEVLDILKKRKAALCMAESEKLVAPAIATADFSYFRYRRTDYSAEERSKIARRVLGELQEGRESFVYFKHEETPAGVLYAQELLASARNQPAGD